jgi:hypothetical protein
VTATDAAGATIGQDAVRVWVSDLVASASASPSIITLGQSSQLAATAERGFPPYRFFWNPSIGLDDDRSPNPIATPAATTHYSVHVCDDILCLERTVVVSVNPVAPSPFPTAFFTARDTCCPPRVNLDASGSTGTIVSYTWDLSWTAASPDLVTTSPTAAFLVDEGDEGTITLTVTAADGRTATVSSNYP